MEKLAYTGEHWVMEYVPTNEGLPVLAFRFKLHEVLVSRMSRLIFGE